jgi:mannose-6-phosphate isomerase-like protein (cupin superfamily)
MTHMRLVRAGEARKFYEGPEECREYFATGKITFGTSTLGPGETGAVDPGHPDSDEVLFVCRGTVKLRNPSDDFSITLAEGDAAVVPSGVAHELENVGDAQALVSWSAGPSPR